MGANNLPGVATQQCTGRESNLRPLESITDKYDRGLSSLLYDQLHWLNVPEQIEYKLAVMIRRCLEDKAPTYLSDYCIPVTAVSSRHLRQSTGSIN